MLKKILIALSLTIAGGGAVYYLYRPEEARPAYSFAKVERGAIAVTVSATGIVNPTITVQVGSQVSGTIQALYADFNQQVREGEVIAQLDPAVKQAQVAQAEAVLQNRIAALKRIESEIAVGEANILNSRAALATSAANEDKAKVSVEDAERNLKRSKELFDQGLIAESQYDTAVTTLALAKSQQRASSSERKSAEAQLQSITVQLKATQAKREEALAQIKEAEADLRMARTNLSYTTIRSPINGTIISRNVDVGQTVAASLQAPTLFTIAKDLSKMQVEASVDEADVGMVREGQTATFTVDAFPSDQFTGKVTQVRNSPKTVQNVVTYDTIIAVDNPQHKLKPGMTATVTIIVEKKDNVLMVPNSALEFSLRGSADRGPRMKDPDRAGQREAMAQRMQGDQGPRGAKQSPRDKSALRTLLVLGEDGKPKPVPVKAGLTDGSNTEVSGDRLSQGLSVIVGYLDRRPAGRSNTNQPQGMRRLFF